MVNGIKAFIGHSFAEEDEAVVRPFLEFCDSVKALGIGFSWEHAKPAEPRELAEKVLRMIEDKNLFIAICTKKERVIAHNNLKASWLRKGVFNASDSDLGWKTSDWIIQEIGLCIGRGMDIILLIEKGLRPPGGLQGNREYIEFERESPERSFKKVLEMIKAILPKIAEIETKPVEGQPPS